MDCSSSNKEETQQKPQQPQQPLTEGLMVLFLLASFTFMFGKLEGFSCETKELLLNSTWVRHVFGLAGLFAVLVIFTRSKPIVSPPTLAAITFGLYAVFLVACRCDARFLGVVLAAVVVVMYLEAERCWRHKVQASDDVSEQRNIERAQMCIEASILVVVALGCLVYIGQHAREYRGQTWSWLTFWLGVSVCKGNGSPTCNSSVLRDMVDGLRRIAGIEPAIPFTFRARRRSRRSSPQTIET